MQTIIKKLNLPPNRRIIVTSDIHGHYEYLKNLLEKVSFTERDILFIVGDILERGPQSLKTLRYIMDLCKGYTVYPLMGNVDAAVLLMLEENNENLFEFIEAMKNRWGSSLFSDMANELNIPIHSPSDMPNLKEKINEQFQEELDFLRNLGTIIETQNFFLFTVVCRLRI